MNQREAKALGLILLPALLLAIIILIYAWPIILGIGILAVIAILYAGATTPESIDSQFARNRHRYNSMLSSSRILESGPNSFTRRCFELGINKGFIESAMKYDAYDFDKKLKYIKYSADSILIHYYPAIQTAETNKIKAEAGWLIDRIIRAELEGNDPESEYLQESLERVFGFFQEPCEFDDFRSSFLVRPIPCPNNAGDSTESQADQKSREAAWLQSQRRLIKEHMLFIREGTGRPTLI